MHFHRTRPSYRALCASPAAQLLPPLRTNGKLRFLLSPRFFLLRAFVRLLIEIPSRADRTRFAIPFCTLDDNVLLQPTLEYFYIFQPTTRGFEIFRKKKKKKLSRSGIKVFRVRVELFGKWRKSGSIFLGFS